MGGDAHVGESQNWESEKEGWVVVEGFCGVGWVPSLGRPLRRRRKREEKQMAGRDASFALKRENYRGRQQGRKEKGENSYTPLIRRKKVALFRRRLCQESKKSFPVLESRT